MSAVLRNLELYAFPGWSLGTSANHRMDPRVRDDIESKKQSRKENRSTVFFLKSRKVIFF